TGPTGSSTTHTPNASCPCGATRHPTSPASSGGCSPATVTPPKPRRSWRNSTAATTSEDTRPAPPPPSTTAADPSTRCTFATPPATQPLPPYRWSRSPTCAACCWSPPAHNPPAPHRPRARLTKPPPPAHRNPCHPGSRTTRGAVTLRDNDVPQPTVTATR